MSGPPVLKFSIANQFTKVFQFGEGTLPDNKYKEVTYNPKVASGFHRIGYYCQDDNRPVVGSVSILGVENDEPENPILKPPVDYTQIWRIQPGGILFAGWDPTATQGFFAPVAPDGYVSLGSVPVKYDYYVNEPDLPKPTESNSVMCLRLDYAVKGKISEIFTFQGDDKWGISSITIYKVEETGVLLAAPGTPPDVYVPRKMPT